MERSAIAQVFAALNASGARYLVVGGLAVVSHGYVRFTKDLDLALAMDEPNLRSALAALEALGFQPLVPVALSDFASAENRARWVEEKNARAFQLYSDHHPTVRIDLMLEVPFDFDEVFERARWDELGGVRAPFLGLDDLIDMKERAGRDVDLLDARQLRRLRDHLPPLEDEEE